MVSEHCSRHNQVLNAHATALLVAAALISGDDGATACSCRRSKLEQVDHYRCNERYTLFYTSLSHDREDEGKLQMAVQGSPRVCCLGEYSARVPNMQAKPDCSNTGHRQVCNRSVPRVLLETFLLSGQQPALHNGDLLYEATQNLLATQMCHESAVSVVSSKTATHPATSTSRHYGSEAG